MNRCPRDRQILASNDANGYRYYSCEHCSGFWIPGAALNRVLAEKGITELGAMPHGEVGEIQCPDCLAECASFSIDGCRLDRCPRCCGIWLDSGEVRRVRRLFPEGSEVVIADESRVPTENQPALVAWSLLDVVGNLFLLILR